MEEIPVQKILCGKIGRKFRLCRRHGKLLDSGSTAQFCTLATLLWLEILVVFFCMNEKYLRFTIQYRY